MKIAIANDHRGYQTKLKIKSILEKQGYEIIDIGTDSEKRVDHPVYAFKLCDYVKEHNVLGIAICGTGLGMSIDCNKVKGIRCAKIDNKLDAEYAKRHNDANVLAFSMHKSPRTIVKFIEIFNKNKVDEDPIYRKRNELVERYENEH